MGRLSGKTAVVTGGSRGIGEAIAAAMSREGARVVITSRKSGEEAAARIGARWSACHSGRAEEIVAFWERLEEPVDILVNNAATNPYFGPMIDADLGAWRKTFEVNLEGTFEMSRQFAKRRFDAGKPGAIVNVASIFGLTAAPMQGIYGMTKAALVSLTKTLAMEWGPGGIRVNAIAPGLVETRFADVLVNSPEILRRYTEHSALGRHAQPEEVAGMAVFLASDEASYVTGQVMPVDGGWLVG